MRRRCPRSAPLGPARLPGYSLKIALPRTHPPAPGWATVVPQPGAMVPGALFALHPEDLPALDDYEGYPELYARRELPVGAGGGTAPALVYVMNGPLKPARPTRAYAEALRRGYRDFKLPMGILEKALRAAQAAG